MQKASSSVSPTPKCWPVLQPSINVDILLTNQINSALYSVGIVQVSSSC